MIVPTNIVATAKNFQITNNLDLSDIPSMLCHDFIHAVLGLGVTTKEEELVEYVENHLEHGILWNEKGNQLALLLPLEFRKLYKRG